MSDAHERTEPATPRRRDRALAEGDRPRSQIAAVAAAFWLAAVPFAFLGRFVEWWLTLYARIAQQPDTQLSIATLEGAQPAITIGIAWVASLAASVAATAACGAVRPSFATLRLRGARLSPSAGVRSIFSREAIVQTAFAVVAVIAIAACAVPIIEHVFALGGATTSWRSVFVQTGNDIAGFWLRASIALTVLAVADVALARRRHAARIRMTPREVRDERIEQEGRPEIKSRRRAIATRRARRLRVSAVKQASAVVTNPTRLAVALRYDPPQIDVPVVVALGAEHCASIVRATAAFYDVPVVESPDLARSLFWRVEVDEAVPEELYAAVAAVFAWILRTRGRLGGSLVD